MVNSWGRPHSYEQNDEFARDPMHLSTSYCQICAKGPAASSWIHVLAPLACFVKGYIFSPDWVDHKLGNSCSRPNAAHPQGMTQR